jgi:hypothetical protein
MTVAGGTSTPLRAWSHGRTQALVNLQHADATGYKLTPVHATAADVIVALNKQLVAN